MQKPFAAFDVDGTIFKSSLLEKLVAQGIDIAVFDRSLFEGSAAKRDEWQQNNNEGLYISYTQRLVAEFLVAIEGVEIDRFREVIDAVVQKHKVRRFAFAKKLLSVLSESHELIAISGSPKDAVEAFLGDLPFDIIYGSHYEHDNGVYTGKAQNVGDKRQILEALCQAGRVSRIGSVSVGDTMGDLSMLEYAEHPIAFNVSLTLTNQITKNGWPRVTEVKDQITRLRFDENIGLYVEETETDFNKALGI